MTAFGLDIGSTTTKIAQVQPEKNKFRLIAAGISPTPQPGLFSEAEKDLIAVATAIKKLHQDARVATRNVVLALPEGQVFTRVIELPQMSENELDQAVPWEAEQFIPVPLSQVTLDWQIVSRGEAGKVEQKMEVFLVAAPVALTQKYLKVIELAGFNPAAIETEIIAATRALVPSTSPPTMLIDFGAKTTDFAIVKKGKVVLTRSIPTAGEAFTRAISSALSLGTKQAEEYKIAYGLSEKELEGKIKGALAPIFDVVVKEIKKALAFWQEKEKEPVSSIILTGGTASLPEATPILTSALGIEVQIADPFVNLIKDEMVIKGLRENAPLFAVTIGLAQKEV